MKKIYTIISFVVLLALSVSCTKNYLEYNTDPYAATEEQIGYDGYIVQGALKTMQGWVLPNEEHRFQFLEVLGAGTLNGYFAEVVSNWSNKFSTYNVSDGWSADVFNNIIPAVFGAHLMLKNSTDDEVVLAVADICEVAIFSKIADAYGPMPYSQLGADGALTAPYDDMETLYNTFFEKLTNAVNVLTENQTAKFNSNADTVFGGDPVLWAKYANSLKLRLAMRVVYVDEELAQKMAEEAVNQSIGTMTSNSDIPEYQHPSENNYFMLCSQWGDYRIAADIISYMNGYKDPRRAKYFTTTTAGTYVGWRRGTLSSDAAKGASCSNIVVEQNTKMMWMCAAEVDFLKAEGALRGWSMGGSAKSFYEEGVKLSFSQWGVDGAASYLADGVSVPADYTDPSSSGYGGTFASSATPAWNDGATFEGNLERIITQKWIAMWRTEGMEAWSEFRRTGYPRLLTAGVNLSGGTVEAGGYARRFIYPISERNGNSENYNQALTDYLKGGDNMGTRLWWDCNPRTK